MAETYKILGQLAPSDSTEKVLYTSPTGTETLVTNVTVTNRTDIEQTFDLNIYNSVKTDGDFTNIVNPVFVAIAGEGTPQNQAAYSPDGATWTRTTMPTESNWSSAVYGNGKFVAVQYGFETSPFLRNVVAYSTNGVTWTSATMPMTTGRGWYAIAYGNNTFVALAENTTVAATSTDGITWTERAMPTASNWYGVAYGNNTFVAIASGTTVYATSPNGVTWTQRAMPASTNWRPIIYSNNKFVALSTNSNIFATSTDGITWTQRTMPAGNWVSITYGKGVYLTTNAGFGSNVSATSADGITWTLRTMPTNTGLFWQGLSYGNGRFVATCYMSVDQTTYENDGKTAYSTDGINWTLAYIPTPVTSRWTTTAYGIDPYVSPKVNNLYKNSTILANESKVLQPGITLAPQKTIVARGSSDLTISAYGVELS